MTYSPSSWLDFLPHQIPFRAASAARRVDEKTMEGLYICSADDGLFEGVVPISMIFEAMAQLGGGVAFAESKSQGWLSAIDDASVDAVLEAGDIVHLRVELEASFGRIFRFRGFGFRQGLEFARAKFYLAEPLGGSL